MKIQILELIEGAKKAQGLTVVIDVFRAYSLEGYMLQGGADRIYPIGDMEDAFAMKREHPDYILIGERGGARVEGCEFGNSPSQVKEVDFTGRRIIHSTSAGTQGMVNAVHADEILAAALTNARATAEYIRRKDPEIVSIVAMGNAGIRTAKEDVLCAEYIRSILEGTKIDMETRTKALQYDGGDHFFDPLRQNIYPTEDFWLCIRRDIFDFAICAKKDEEGKLITVKYPMA
jgi:2-phosphosulfolactate phosphatase